MRFDTVIGNPPYNKGMDLDFVYFGYRNATNLVVMIIPAKWQTAADDYIGCASRNITYKEFRQKFTSHMKEIVFYPLCTDIFDIWQTDGITYFSIDVNREYAKKHIVNRCSRQRFFNSETYRSIDNRETLINIGAEIIEYISPYTSFTFLPSYGEYKVMTNTQTPGGGLLGMGEDGKAQYIGISGIYTDETLSKAPEASKETFASDNINECKSFLSWLNTRFTRFFIALNISKLNNVLTDDYFRFVPAPPNYCVGVAGKEVWNHMYTDYELYKFFGLLKPEAQTSTGVRYIDIIESIVKQR